MKKIFFILIILYSCNGHKSEKQNSNTVTNTLSDSLFVLKNINGSDAIDQIKNNMDTVSGKYLVSLDSLQKNWLIAPLSGLIHNEREAPGEFMNAAFVSKQDKIGKFTPITIFVDWDDYCALFYIVLDEKLSPVSAYTLRGGSCAGPGVIDSIMETCPRKTSFITNKGISSYLIKEQFKIHNDSNSISMPEHIISTIDSIRYFTKILPNGKMQTTRLDSTRYKRPRI